MDFHCRAKFKWFYFVDMSCDVNCLHNIKNSTAPNFLRLRTQGFRTSLLMSTWLGLVPQLWGNFSRLGTVEPYSSLLHPLRMKSQLSPYARDNCACKIYITRPGRSIPEVRGERWGGGGGRSVGGEG